MAHGRWLENFGQTVRFCAAHYYEPRSALELLRLLQFHAGDTIRAIGSLHSWSDAARGERVVLNLKHFSTIRIGEDARSAELDAGVRIADAAAALRPYGLALPTQGAFGGQTIAGAIATATHGSGKPSLSHYVAEVVVATYDRNGRPVLRRIRGGRALDAARCALGRMGVVLRVTVRCTTAHCIEEVTTKETRPLSALARAREPDATQCYLIPWAWVWVVQRRRRVDGLPASTLTVARYRLKRFLLQTLGVDFITWICARALGRPGLLRRIYPPLFARLKPISIVAHAERILLSTHLLRYSEAEVFVPVACVESAAEFVEAVLRYVGGDPGGASPLVCELLSAPELESLEALRGRYVHHYPITFRRVRRDDTLISMTSDADRFAISLISFSRPGGPHFEAFEAVIRSMAPAMRRTFDARWHWGKLLPLERTSEGVPTPGLTDFAAECEAIDPQRRFRSAFTERTLGV